MPSTNALGHSYGQTSGSAGYEDQAKTRPLGVTVTSDADATTIESSLLNQ